MPISVEQWRAATGSLNAGKGSLRPRHKINPLSSFSLSDLPSPPPSSWKGYYTVIALLCVPLLYKMYLVGVAVVMYLNMCGRSQGVHGSTLIGRYYDTSVGITADVSILDDHRGGVLFLLLNVVLYVAMVMTVLLIGGQDHRGSDKHQWKLTRQIHHLDLFWLNSGSDCEIIFDTNTGSMCATLSINFKGALQHVRRMPTCKKSKKTIFSIGFSFLRILSPQFILQLSTLVLAMLLLLAGDVEKNPGPITELTIKNHYKVNSYLKDIEDKQLRELGGALGLHYPKLKRMNDLPSDMVAAWLRSEDGVQTTSGPPSWDSLLKALREIGQTGIAEKIERENTEIQSACSTRKRSRSSSQYHTSEGITNKENLKDQALSLGIPRSASTATKESPGIEEDCERPLSPKILRHSFPYLDLSGITPAEKEALEAKLRHDFIEMTEEFEDLKNSITDSMEERNITIAKLVRCISETAKTLEPVSTNSECKETPKLYDQFCELNEATSLDKAMLFLSKYTSFFNYRLVKQIIKGCGTDTDKQRLVKYEQAFEKYAQRSVYEYPQEVGYASENGWPSFLIKFHPKCFKDCSIDHLQQFIDNVASILNLPIELLLLKSVKPGCLELTLQVPPSIYQNSFPLSPQQEAALAALGVIKITAGDYQYPSNRDEGDDSDRRDDPEPDHGTDGGDLQHSHSVQDDVADNGKEPSNNLSDTAGNVRHSPDDLSDSDKSTDQLNDSLPPSEYQYLFLHEEQRQGQTDDKLKDKGSDSGLGTHGSSTTHGSTTTRAELLECEKDIIEGHGTNPYEVQTNLTGPVAAIQFSASKVNEAITQLHIATYLGKLEDIQRMVETEMYNPLQEDQFGNTPLHYAVECHHLNVVKYLIENQECNPTIFGTYGETPLHLAARLGHLDIVTYLISEHGVDPMCEDRENDITPLHSACIGGNLDVVLYLIDHFKKYLDIKEIVSDKGRHALTPLHYSVIYNHIAVVKHFVLNLNCNPNITAENGVTPLHAAAQEGHVDIMKVLIDSAKCNPSQVDNNNATPLHTAAGEGKLEAVKLLTLDKGCDPLCRDKDGDAPLHVATFCGHLVVVKFLIKELNCDPNIPGQNGLTPLHAAAQEGHVDIMKFLIDSAKYNPSQVDNSNATPLHTAAGKGKLEAVKLLTLDKGCDPLCRDKDGDTPLNVASFCGHLVVVKFLIMELNCDPNIPGQNGLTPLHAAAQNGHVDMMKFLIDSAKCNPSQVNNSNATPLHTAAAKGKLEAVKLLTLDKGCDPLCRDKVGNAPLHMASLRGHLVVVKFLIKELNCDPNIPGLNGLTPLHAAAQVGHVDIMKFLIDSAKCNPSQVANSNATPLHTAAGKGKLEAVKLLTLDKGCNYLCMDVMGAIPLHYATMFGHLNIVKFYMEHLKCPPDVPSFIGTPLTIAAKSGHHKILKYLQAVVVVRSGINFYKIYLAKFRSR